MKSKRTIPLNLDDWLKSFRSSLKDHPFPREIAADWNEGREELPDSLTSRGDNMVLSFAV